MDVCSTRGELPRPERETGTLHAGNPRTEDASEVAVIPLVPGAEASFVSRGIGET
jgi:hypothetical protein